MIDAKYICRECCRDVRDGTHQVLDLPISGIIVLECPWPDRLDLSPQAQQFREEAVQSVRAQDAAEAARGPRVHVFSMGPTFTR